MVIEENQSTTVKITDRIPNPVRQIFTSVWLSIVALGMLFGIIGAILSTGDIAGILGVLGAIYILMGAIGYLTALSVNKLNLL